MTQIRALAAGLFLAVFTIACTGAAETEDATHTEPVLTGTPVPRLQLDAFAGNWERWATLTLNADGTYEIASDLGADVGEYRYRPKARTLRLTTTAGDMCSSGDRARFPVLLEEHQDGEVTRLILGYELEECELRGELPHIYDMPGVPKEGLAGEWALRAAIEIDVEGTYAIVTPNGRDVGTFIYDDWNEALTIETAEGELCEPGARSLVRVAKGRLLLNITLSMGFDDSGSPQPCFARAGLAGLYLAADN